MRARFRVSYAAALAFATAAAALGAQAPGSTTPAVDPLELGACRLGRAVVDVVGPETDTGSIGFAQEEVVILLAHKVRRVIDRVGYRLN